MTDKPKLYQVTWVIELGAESHVEAAGLALEIQRDRESLATVFEIQEILSASRRIDVRACVFDGELTLPSERVYQLRPEAK